MSIVSLSAFHSTPAGYIEAVCIGCNAAIEIPSGSNDPICQSCQRSNAEAEARKLLADVRDLTAGTGIFAALAPDERREQIRALVISTDDRQPATKPLDRAISDFVSVLSETSIDFLADLIAQRIAARKPSTSKVPLIVKCSVADLTDAALIDLIGGTDEPILLNAASAELASRLGNLSDSLPMPIYSAPVDATPDAATRFELEGKIEASQPFNPALPDEDPRAGSWDSDFAA